MVPGWHASAYLCWLPPVDTFSAVDLVDRTSGDSLDLEHSGEETGSRDIIDDEYLLMYLRTGIIVGAADSRERDRILQRAKRFRLEGSHVLRVWGDGRERLGATSFPKSSVGTSCS